MPSVTRWIAKLEQPEGGFVPKELFRKEVFYSRERLNPKENVSPCIVGVVVDYLTRWSIHKNVEEAFHIPLAGIYNAKMLYGFIKSAAKGKSIFEKLKSNLDTHKKLTDEAIVLACKLWIWDRALREGPSYLFDECKLDSINPDKRTIENIRLLVKRSVYFLNSRGSDIVCGFSFSFLNTSCKEIDSGDGDFLTRKDLIDMKVTRSQKYLISEETTLQLLVYYLLGKECQDKRFSEIKNLVAFSPRLNIACFCSVSEIDQKIIEEIKKRW